MNAFAAKDERFIVRYLCFILREQPGMNALSVFGEKVSEVI